MPLTIKVVPRSLERRQRELTLWLTGIAIPFLVEHVANVLFMTVIDLIV